MVTQQLLDYINAEKQKGVNDEGIRQALLKSNWSEADINQAFASLEKGIPAPLIPTHPQPASNTKTIIVVLLLIFWYFIGLILMWAWMKQWPKWVKWLITSPIILAVLGIVIATLLMAINPFGHLKGTPSKGSTNNSQTTPQISPTVSILPIQKVTVQDNTFGPINAKVQLVEYGDFQCPACAAEFPVVEQARQAYKDKVLFVYRYFPLEQIHQNSLASAQAAYAASKQEKFWEMYTLLYQNQNNWANASNSANLFSSYAGQIGLSLTQYNKDYSDPQALKIINNSENEGLSAGVNTVPTFFINGKMISNNGYPPSYVQLSQIINSKLNSQ